MADHADLKTYRGNCHCGAYVFEAKLPELKIVDRCNCSVCFKKGVLYAFPKQGDLNFVKGDPSTMASYTFNRNLLNHKFCSNCGTSILCVGHMMAPKPGEEKAVATAVNVRTFQDVDIWSLETRLFDGAALPPLYEAPKFTGTEPQAELEGGKIYTGSCHCGAVKIAVKTKPLDKDYDDHVIDCNCSICVRYGATWIYPKHEYGAIEGKENLSRYELGRQISLKSFCKICGVVVQSKLAELTEEQTAALPEEVRKWLEFGKDYFAINAKILNGVDLESLKVNKVDGWNTREPKYVNP